MTPSSLYPHWQESLLPSYRNITKRENVRLPNIIMARLTLTVKLYAVRHENISNDTPKRFRADLIG